MGFSDEVVKESQSPIVLVEIDQNRSQDRWYIYEAGIWYYHFTLSETGILFGDFWERPDSYNRERLNIQSFSVGLTSYTEVSNLTELESQNESWYYDDSTTKLYVHFDNFDPYYAFSNKKVGISLSWCDTRNIDGYVDDNDIFYEPRIESLPQIKFEKDNLFFGVIQNDSASFSVLNGELNDIDDIATQNLFGNLARIKLGYPDIATNEFKQLFTGRVSNIPEVAQDRVGFQLKSERAFFTKKIGTQLYSNTDTTADYYYADLSDDDSGQPVPLLFGNCRNVPCVNLDFSATPTNYTYKVCATDLPNSTHFDIQDITAAYVDGIEKSIVSKDLVNGTFEIAGSNVKDGSSFKEVTADVEGYVESGSLIENPLRIIEIILDVYKNIEFTSVNYDLDEWNNSKSQSSNIHLYVNERKQILDIIADISSVQGFLFVKGDGKITFRLKDNSAASVESITQDELLTLEVARYDAKEILSTATVKYDRNWNKNRFRAVTDKTREEMVLSTTNTDRNKDFETLLVNKSDAESFAVELMDESFFVRPEFPIKTFMQYTELEIGQNVNCEINRIDREFFGDVKCEILKHEIDLNNFNINMTLKYIEEVT